jgi:AcrR family transcriptional regulator
MAVSRQRVRPTRQETRARLFEAAGRLFEERGIGAASIDAIAQAAGFTRGAFYSNFADKDELIIEMLSDHVEQSTRRNLDLLERHRDPEGFLAALREADRDRHDPLGRAPLLHMELILYTARAGRYRPQLAERLRARRALAAQIVAATGEGRAPALVEPQRVAAMLLALEDGFRLHRLIDPNSTPPGSFLDTVAELQRLVRGLAATAQARGPAAGSPENGSRGAAPTGDDRPHGTEHGTR